jgi:CRP-like cAMP-binding protein
VPSQPANRAAVTNRLLAALPVAVRRHLLAHATRVQLTTGSVLHEAGTLVSHVFFPIDSFVALVCGAPGDVKLEVGLVGNEGMLGITLALGVQPAPVQWLVQGAGRAWRIDAAAFRDELDHSQELRRALHCYLLVVLAQLVQTAACKRFHVVEARLARWLLMTRDRAYADAFHITHEALAHLMGVRRAGITKAANSLHRRNLIRYYRGDLRILDGAGLEAASCGCYAADNQTYASVLGTH